MRDAKPRPLTARIASAAGGTEAASPWVARWARELPPECRVLDLAAGRGRHARHLAACGHRVEAVDRDVSALAGPGIRIREADLEAGPWPYRREAFDAMVVTNYLHRPLFPRLIEALAPGGMLIYETFMAGNERYGRPSNPDFLLRRNELLQAFGGMEVLGFEQGYAALPKPAMMQRLCARKRVAGC